MLFQTLTEQVSKPSFLLQVSNLEISGQHWKSLKYLQRLAEELELLYIKSGKEENFPAKLIKFLLDVSLENRRIEQMKFYQDQDRLQVLAISSLPAFKKENYLQRSIKMTFPKLNYGLDITEITNEEWDEVLSEEKRLPAEWKPNEHLTLSFAKYHELFV